MKSEFPYQVYVVGYREYLVRKELLGRVSSRSSRRLIVYGIGTHAIYHPNPCPDVHELYVLSLEHFILV